jgi:hypothetical protein
MGGGYVLDFSNASFQSFIHEVTGVNIDDSKYSLYGGSKAKRLRGLWARESDPFVGKLCEKLMEYEAAMSSDVSPEKVALRGQCAAVVGRLLGRPVASAPAPKPRVESDILQEDFSGVRVDDLKLEHQVVDILKARLTEAQACFGAKAYLSVVILCGSVLEALLLVCAQADPKAFNQATCAAKDANGNVKKFPDWTLSQFIDVATETGKLSQDVKKFGHALRDFRNFVHPYQQMASGFAPDDHTARIALQVLKAAIADISGKRGVR